MLAWRIVRPAHVANPLSGAGAARAGSRWNPVGVRMAYTSSTRALAVLEMLVHVPRQFFPLDAVLLPVGIPDSLIAELPELPENWNDFPYSYEARQTGELWIRQATSAAMLVPSAVIPAEKNILVNPSHPDLSRIRVGPPETQALDRRLFGNRQFR